jgi:hypothetical protein
LAAIVTNYWRSPTHKKPSKTTKWPYETASSSQSAYNFRRVVCNAKTMKPRNVWWPVPILMKAG